VTGDGAVHQPTGGVSDSATGAAGDLSTPGSVPTGDIVIDAALEDLDNVDVDDLDACVRAAEDLQRTLQARLAHLGG
jgi:hypothetical protein